MPERECFAENGGREGVFREEQWPGKGASRGTDTGKKCLAESCGREGVIRGDGGGNGVLDGRVSETR